jgi:biopolymer transport protein ExbD
MATRRKINFNTEAQIDTELDMAPLLSIMVKLIPVLLLSSAFVQIMMIETELPQAVRSAIEHNQKNEEKPEIDVTIDYSKGFQIAVTVPRKGIEQVNIPASEGKKLDFEAFNQELVKIKNRYSQIFELNIIPSPEVDYQDIVKTMDMARRPLEKGVKFEFIDPQTNQPQQTEFMFPEVNFSNILEG